MCKTMYKESSAYSDLKLEVLRESVSESLWLLCVRNQLSDKSLFELSKDLKLRGIFAMTGRRVGRHAQIIATFNSTMLQSRKIVKSSITEG